MIGFNKQEKRVALSILMVYLITSIHHIYGAWLYDTPWRNHIATQGASWLIISYAILVIYVKWKKKWISWVFVVFAGFFFIGAIGFYEGAYNHVLKNILYFSGFDSAQMLSLYPPPKYELPNDILFESTGILTFGISMWSLRTMIGLIKSGYQ